MNCLRCARETEENHLFCNQCMKDMERHPVKPGTPVHLPDRPEKAPTKRNVFKVAASKWEDHIYRLKSAIIWLLLLIILLATALGICICMMAGLTPRWLNEALHYIR